MLMFLHFSGDEIDEDLLETALRMAQEETEDQILDLETSLNPAPINPGQFFKTNNPRYLVGLSLLLLSA